MLRELGVPIAFAVAAGLGVAGWGLSQRLAQWDGPSSYVSAESCAGCHQSIWDSYSQTAMAHSFRRLAASEEPTEGLPLNGAFDHSASGDRFSMVRRAGKTYQRREQGSVGGQGSEVVEKSVDYVLGSGNRARTFLHRTERDTLVELPMAWYAEGGGTWAMSPGFDQPDHWGFRREATYECLFCHNAYPTLVVSDAGGDETVFPPTLPEGIDCQRCHGPGRRHVELASTPGNTPAVVRQAIVNPANLSPERQLEVCMQCHLETTSMPLPNAIRRFDRAPFSYIAGQPLGDFQLYFDHPLGSQHDDKFEIVSAAYGLRQSACFRQSEGRLLCTTCHDPHGESAPGSAAGACGQCHQSKLASLVASGTHTASTSCVDCHMAKRRTDDVVHAVMTDHRIQRPNQVQNSTAPKVERTSAEVAAYRGPVAPYYPEPWPATAEGELYLAVAQTKDGSNRGQGVIQLEAAITRHQPSQAQFYTELADALIAVGEKARSLPYYRRSAERQPNAGNLRRLAGALRELSQLSEASGIAQQALESAPADYRSWQELGLIRLAQGRDNDAVAAFEKALALNPDLPEASNNLGAVWMRRGDPRRAEAAFRQALRADPSFAGAHANLANLLASGQGLEYAEEHFKTALKFRPGDDVARYNYAVALVRVSRLQEAQDQLSLAVDANPDRAETQLLLGDLLRAEGQIASAIARYREALRIQPDFARAHLSLGAALVNSGQMAEGLEHIRRAAAGSDADVRQEAASVLKQLDVRP